MTLSHKISRRTMLKGTGALLISAATAGVLGGCSGITTGSIEVKVGDAVNNWNGLTVRLSGLFNLSIAPEQAGYEYVGVLVAVQNQSGKACAIGAQNILEIDAAYPLPPLSNVAPYFHALAESTTDFEMACDGQPVEGGAYLYVYDAETNILADAPTLPPDRGGYIELVCVVPNGWQELKVTYSPTFVSNRTLTFTMSSSELISAAASEDAELTE